MLTTGSKPAHERLVRAAARQTLARRLIRRRIAAAFAVACAIIVPLAAASPAYADQARQREQWVLSALDVPAAWHITHGQGVTVAVIDSGVDPHVSDLTGSVTSGPDLTGVHTPPSNPSWGAHGTWMASLIAGHGHGKGNGILGVAPRSHILSIRVITDQSDPGYQRYHHEAASRAQLQLAKAIRYAVHKHAGVISMSLGYEAASLVVRSALQYALAHNVVVVASSGNSQKPHTAAPYSFPADYPGVIGVAAVSQSGQPAYFSSENLSVQVAAPGVDVPAQGRGSKYWLVSGTSPACALTAGVAALIRSRYPRLSAARVRSAITLSASRFPGYDDQVGFGTVDALKALQKAGGLARQAPGGRTTAGKAAASGNFGRGSAGVPPFPVPPRSRLKLLVLLGISAVCLLVFTGALWRLVARRGRRKAAVAAGRGQGGPPTTAGPAGPPLPGGTAAAGLYPTQIYPAQPYRQGRPDIGYLGQPVGYPPPGSIGQRGQGVPGQGVPGQGTPGQGVPRQAGQYPAGAPVDGAGQVLPGAGHAGYTVPGSPGPAQVQPGSVPSWRTTGSPDQTTPRMAFFELKASGRLAAQGDDDWLFEQTGPAGAQPGQARPSAPAAGRWSSSLSERLEAAARAREQAQAAAAAATQTGAQPQVPPQPDAPVPEAPALPEVAARPEVGATPPATAQPGVSAMPLTAGAPAALTRPDISVITPPVTTPPPPGQPGVQETPQAWANDRRPGDPAEPVYRSVWEPLVRNSGVSGSASDLPVGQVGSPPAAPLGSLAQPNHGSSIGSPTQSGDGRSSQAPAGSAPTPPSSPTASGPAPLPRRQPQTHLAAPLRRQRPAQTAWQQAEPSQSLSSVWDAVRPAPTTERKTSSTASDSLDDQA
jgi:type VII secretion-associated serine protease mycosin